jgi:hypothetical protein
MCSPPAPESPHPAEAFQIPDDLVADPDDQVKQSEVLDQIIATTLDDPANIDMFNERRVFNLKLSHLRRLYENKDPSAMELLSYRHKVIIDDDYRVETGKGQVMTNTDKTMIDYHLTVANCMGLSPLLPNAASMHRFSFDMNLKQPLREFKGKHAMVGFDTKGRMLYIGHAMDEDVFLAMAPNEFLNDHYEACDPGYSTGPSLMATRHYRQVVMMIVHFLQRIPERAYFNLDNDYALDLDGPSEHCRLWSEFTNALYVHVTP